MVPLQDACRTEQKLHEELLSDPRRPVRSERITAIVDADARENWELWVSWRDHLARHAFLSHFWKRRTLRAIVRYGRKFPHIFLDQLVQVILRNALDDCADAFLLRAAELFFRPQQLAFHQGSLIAADQETGCAMGTGTPSPLSSLLGLGAPQIEVLSEGNAASYWERSDLFDFALDLTAGRRGLAALGAVVGRWVRHLLTIEVTVEAVTELRDVVFSWYVGLDARLHENRRRPVERRRTRSCSARACGRPFEAGPPFLRHATPGVPAPERTHLSADGNVQRTASYG